VLVGARALSKSLGERPRILLTGSRGQLGYELHRELANVGQVFAYGREGLDLSSETALRAAVRTVKPQLIVNAAAYTAVDRAESDVEVCERVNAEAPRVLAEEAKRQGAAMVHYSTDYVFDGTKSSAYVETDATSPLSVYGRTKLEGERAVVSSGAPYLVLRLSWVYGARGKNFLRTMLRLAAERDELRVVADQIGAPTWCRAIAAATAQAVAQVSPRGVSIDQGIERVAGVYHLTAQGCASWHGFASAIIDRAAVLGIVRAPRVTAIATAEYPTPAKRPARSLLDSSRFASVFALTLPTWETQLDFVMDEVIAPAQ
jgi:dTDP-4-dehydrorhamnose reductase